MKMFYNVEAYYHGDDRYTGPLSLEEAVKEKSLLVREWGLELNEVTIVQC
ncbi:hypothetical protein [Weissella viridescens]